VCPPSGLVLGQYERAREFPARHHLESTPNSETGMVSWSPGLTISTKTVFEQSLDIVGAAPELPPPSSARIKSNQGFVSGVGPAPGAGGDQAAAVTECPNRRGPCRPAAVVDDSRRPGPQ